MNTSEQFHLFNSPSTKTNVSALPRHNQENRRLTEITLNSNPLLVKSILAGMLMELSENADQRWLCWVSDQPLKPLLHCNTSRRTPNRILQVVNNKHRRDNHTLTQIAIRALERGKSHTVAILVDGTVSKEEKAQLESAAHTGNAECLLIQTR